MKQAKNNHLAEGEVTGHYHNAVGKGVKVYEDNGAVCVLDAPNGCDVTHQEHSTIPIPPGRYNIGIVREQNHAENAAREVRD